MLYIYLIIFISMLFPWKSVFICLWYIYNSDIIRQEISLGSVHFPGYNYFSSLRKFFDIIYLLLRPLVDFFWLCCPLSISIICILLLESSCFVPNKSAVIGKRDYQCSRHVKTGSASGFSDSRYHTSLIFLQRTDSFRMLRLRAKGTKISLCL